MAEAVLWAGLSLANRRAFSSGSLFSLFLPRSFSQAPYAPRDAAIHSLPGRPPFCTTFALTSRHGRSDPIVKLYFYPTVCIFATSLQAVNVPDHITTHEYREYISRFATTYIMLDYDYEEKIKMMIGRITIGLKGCRDIMIPKRFHRLKKIVPIMISSRGKHERRVVFREK